MTRLMMNEYKQVIDKMLLDYMPKPHGHYNQRVIDAMTYSLSVGGKRIRPMLILSGFKAVCQKGIDINLELETVVHPFMVALEMIHTYSLIHDDLPAMDNDDLRRGRPTCHIHFDEGTAILAGDGLLNLAFETVINSMSQINDIDKLKAMLKGADILAKASGVQGMIGGQCADMMFEHEPMNDAKDLIYVQEHKTGAIIEAGLVIGGLLGQGTENEINSLYTIGHNLGRAFQIQDDTLDQTSSEAKLGKPIGSDIKNKKMTYLTHHSIVEARAKADLLMDESIEIAKKLSSDTEMLIDLLTFIRNRDY